MKRCPTCDRTYADDTLSYCLVDGSILSASFDRDAPTLKITHDSADSPVAPHIEHKGTPVKSSGRKRTKSIVLISVLSICFIVIALFAIFWRSRTNPENQKATNTSNNPTKSTATPDTGPIAGVICKNPPVSAMLNYWPVTYTSPAEFCHDYPTIDARFVNGGKYSQNQEEWENGRTAHAGDELYILIWINNGALENAEEILPGHGIARNVRLKVETDTQPGTVHYINVHIEGDNTNIVRSRFKIFTAENERLEVIAGSGKIANHKGTSFLKENLDVGNGTTLVGDFPPRFEDGRFVRFTVRVIA